MLDTSPTHDIYAIFDDKYVNLYLFEDCPPVKDFVYIQYEAMVFLTGSKVALVRKCSFETVLNVAD